MIVVTTKQIADMIAAHALWLAGSDQNPGKQAVFTGMNISGYDFTSDNLSRADFSGANCSSCIFTSATCTGANFTGAALVGANFTSANLTDANLTGASRENIIMTGATTTGIQGVDLTQTLGSGVTTLAVECPILYSTVTSLTAFAGGGQASATALTGDINFVTTVATAADSVKLPTPVVGKSIMVRNGGANSLNVFPTSGVAIDNLGADAAYALGAATWREFVCQSTTQWRSKS